MLLNSKLFRFKVITIYTMYKNNRSWINFAPISILLSDNLDLFFLERSDRNYDEILRFHNYLETTFPLVHKHLRKEVINTHSLLYTWTGSDSSLKPVLFASHIDVVPIEPGKL